MAQGFYGGYLGNAGALGDLVYRGESVSPVPMPYYGGGMGIEILAGSPSFDINRRPGTLGGRTGEQLKRLYEGGTQQNEKLNEELRNRGIMPGSGPQLPLAFGGGSNFAIGNAAGVANAQFFNGPQFAQAAGFQDKFVY